MEEVLRMAFAADAGREGYYTAGHEASVSAEDVEEAKMSGSNLMYGEFLPSGFEKAMDEEHLFAARGGTLVELGSGTGKPALQALLQFPFTRVIGVELCAARHEIGARALRRLCGEMPSCFWLVEDAGSQITVATTLTATTVAVSKTAAATTTTMPTTTRRATRTLTLRRGDMLSTPADEVASANVLVMETCLPQPIFRSVCALLQQASIGARLLMYNDAREVALSADGDGDESGGGFGLLNVDRFLTSWAPKNGHPFYVYERTRERRVPFEEDGAVAGARYLDVVVLNNEQQQLQQHQDQRRQQQGGGGEEGGLGEEGGVRWHVGDAVETQSIFFPSDAWFEGDAGGEWYRGWLIRVSEGRGKDGEPLFSVIYEDGDVAEDLPLSQVRRPLPLPPLSPQGESAA